MVFATRLVVFLLLCYCRYFDETFTAILLVFHCCGYNWAIAQKSIHSSKVLTDHFSNSLSEETTNDIPIKFSQCHFNSTFYLLPLSNRGIYLQIIHVRRKAGFMFCRTCIACINNITFEIEYFTRQ